MPDEVTKKLQERKDAITKESEELGKVRENAIQKGSELQRQLNEIDARMRQLQGAYTEVENLLNPKEATPPVEDKKKK